MCNSEFNLSYELIIDGLFERGYAVLDCFFLPKEVDLLRASLLMKQDLYQFKKAAVGQASQEQVIQEIRGDSILWLDENAPDEIEKIYFNKINDLIAYMNRTCYMGLQEGEFHYANYQPGTRYQRHLDVFHKDTRRKLSVVLYLNENDWTPASGGELVLYLIDANNQEKEEVIFAIPGRLVIFDSKKIPHEVKLVHKSRYSITGWLKTR